MSDYKHYAALTDDFAQTEAYRKVLEHRNNCDKWGNDFCLECFGGGLTRFTDQLAKEVFLE